jgi:hypothetical protein
MGFAIIHEPGTFLRAAAWTFSDDRFIGFIADAITGCADCVVSAISCTTADGSRRPKVLNDFLLELGKQGQGGNNR